MTLGELDNRMSKTAILKLILIGDLNIKVGLKNCLGFYVNRFFYKFFKTIKLLVVLIVFGLDCKF